MSKILVWLIALVALLLFAAWRLISAAGGGANFRLELAQALINLTVALLITGVLSSVLNHRNVERSRRDDRAAVLSGALQNLKAGYERVQVARFFLPPGHRTSAARRRSASSGRQRRRRRADTARAAADR